MENTEYMKDPEFLDWLTSNGVDKKELEDEINNNNFGRLDDLVLRFNDHNSQEENNFITFSQGKPGDGNEPTNDLDAYYKNWCEKEHNPPYVYENTNETSPAYGMKYYKTQEDKNADKPAARALYSDAKHVDVECSDDKGPDYEFLDALVRKAAIDGQPGINFEEGMTPEFANKLAAACIKYGLKMKGQPTNIDIHEFEDQLTAEQKANIEKYNKGEKVYLNSYEKKSAIAKDFAAHGTTEADIAKFKDDNVAQAEWFAAYREAGIKPQGANGFYSLNNTKMKNLPQSAKDHLKEHNRETVAKLYNVAKSHADAYKQANPGKDFDLRTSKVKDPKSAALLYAAYKAAGVNVIGMDEVNKDSQGMFQTETLGFMPKEAQDIVTDYNYGIRTQQWAQITRDKDDKYNQAIMSPNPTVEQQEIIARYEERREAQAARGRTHLARKNHKAPNAADMARVNAQGRQAALNKIRQAQGR